MVAESLCDIIYVGDFLNVISVIKGWKFPVLPFLLADQCYLSPSDQCDNVLKCHQLAPLIQKYFCTWRKFWSSNPYSSFELRCWFCFSWICSISFQCRCFVNFLVDLHLIVIHFRFINSVNLEFFCNFLSANQIDLPLV